MFSRCLLLLVVCLQTFTMAQYTAANGAAECCFEFHKRPFPTANVVFYKETRFDCTLPGVILTTKKNLRICADPEVDWVKQIIANKNLDKTQTTNENFSPYANGASECCFEFHKRPFPMANVVFYEETRSDCTLPGVLLTTRKGYRICADPEVDWVKQIIANKNLDKTQTTI